MKLLKTTFTQFSTDNCTTLAAALAYYTVFALPPLLYLLLTIVTYSMTVAYDADVAREKAQRLIENQAGQLIGNEAAADEITTILEENRQQGGVWWKSLVSLAGILFGATGLVAAVQASLNLVWRVQPDPDQGGVKSFVVKRVLSLGMILGLGFLLLVSMVVSTVLAAVGSQIGQWVGLEETVVAFLNYAVIFVVTMVIFAAMFKFMPDAEIGWRDVAVGAFVTAGLFSLGRYGLGIYFENADPAARLGSAAASLAVLLVWVYYSSMIFLLGAEFTQAWATVYGRGLEPEEGAVRVERRLVSGDRATTS
ncbi:YihY/virulence factor BrkB family protein [Rhodopirellula sp. JC639]|uniref:YihY/virulence factor BrkB family protein n=1 Tax=Stieleria mannarensis TaxID=2755585 RepID=UPI00160005B1|nr:YihY/virulence factor BrkB family protein [Rhodopirellula sp. JC639]